MNTPAKMLAEKLLHISAIKLQPSMPFVWNSGWNSPIYNDHRKALSYPDVRNFIKIEMARMIMENYPEVDAIASVCNGAISWGALAADVMGLPFAYVRDTPKDHGLENRIEGNLKPGWKVVVIEDLISTGGTSVRVADAVVNAGCEVIGVAALFNYEFPVSAKRYRDANLNAVSLCTYTTMLEVAEKIQYISNEEAETLREWRKDPGAWVPDLPNPF